MITRDQLSQFFSDTRALFVDGRAKFDVDRACRWSFFFIDSNRAKLAPIERALQAQGYTNVAYLEPDSANDAHVYYLRADRIESHTIDSLFARNAQLYAMAAECGVSSYDGMDVGDI